MTQPAFDRLLLPVADTADAEETYRTVKPYAEAATTEVIVLHVSETEDRNSDTETSRSLDDNADEIFEPFLDGFDTETTVRTEHRMGPDPIAEIAATADELAVTAIGILPRPKSLFLQILSRERTTTLISSTNVPVLVFPDQDRKHTDVPQFDEDGDVQWTPTVLVPVEGSEKSFNALEFVCNSFDDALVIALHVFEPPAADIYSTMTPGKSNEFKKAKEKRRRDVSALFEEITDIVDQYGIALKTKTRSGDVQSNILEYATIRPVDLIALGSDQHEELDRNRLGRISKGLFFNAPVPILIV